MSDETAESSVVATIPIELLKFIRRVHALEDGRYQLIVTVENKLLSDWTVDKLGKVEKPAQP